MHLSYSAVVSLSHRIGTSYKTAHVAPLFLVKNIVEFSKTIPHCEGLVVKYIDTTPVCRMS